MVNKSEYFKKQVINCTKIREEILKKVAEEVSTLPTQPHLAVIIVGNDKASETYVRNKRTTCEKVGIKSTVISLPECITPQALELVINQANDDKSIHGILLQLPLPKGRGFDEQKLIDLISPNKDVDGLTVHNQGLLALGRLDEAILPCTPSGVLRMFDEIGYDLEGKTVTVVGRSNLFGKPMAQLCLSRNATVKMCHSRTVALESELEFQDVVISAIGQPKFLGSEYLAYNDILVDVGINRDENDKLCGDIDIEDVLSHYSSRNLKYYTPVPRGVGLLTVACLMENVLKCYKLQAEEVYTWQV